MEYFFIFWTIHTFREIFKGIQTWSGEMVVHSIKEIQTWSGKMALNSVCSLKDPCMFCWWTWLRCCFIHQSKSGANYCQTGQMKIMRRPRFLVGVPLGLLTSSFAPIALMVKNLCHQRISELGILVGWWVWRWWCCWWRYLGVMVGPLPLENAWL